MKVASRLSRHFAEIERLQRIATKARHHAEDHDRGREAHEPSKPADVWKWLLLNVPVVLGTYTLVRLYPNATSSMLLIGFVGVSGVWRYYAYRRDQDERDRLRSAAGLDTLNVDLGWAQCNYCGGSLPVCTEPPECPFCDSPLLLSAQTKVKIVESARRDVSRRVDHARASERAHLEAQKRSAVLQAKYSAAFSAAWVALISGWVTYSALGNTTLRELHTSIIATATAAVIGYVVYCLALSKTAEDLTR